MHCPVILHSLTSLSVQTAVQKNEVKQFENKMESLIGCEVCTVKYKARGLPYSPSLRGLYVETKGVVFYSTDRAYPVNKEFIK